MRCRQSNDVVEEGARVVGTLQLLYEEIGDPGLVKTVRHSGQHQYSPGFSREGEEASRTVMVDELPHAHLIPCAKELAYARIPNREREITEETIEAGSAPLKIGGQDHFVVACSGGTFIEPQCGQQLGPVVEAHIPRDDAAGGVMLKWKALKHSFRR